MVVSLSGPFGWLLPIFDAARGGSSPQLRGLPPGGLHIPGVLDATSRSLLRRTRDTGCIITIQSGIADSNSPELVRENYSISFQQVGTLRVADKRVQVGVANHLDRVLRPFNQVYGIRHDAPVLPRPDSRVLHPGRTLGLAHGRDVHSPIG